MSEIIEKTQKQELGSAIVSLFEIAISDVDTIYFYNGLDSDMLSVEFDGNTYTPIPILLDGIDIESAGTYARPLLTIGNITSVLSGSLLDGQSYEDLIGKRMVRRLTLAEYLSIGSSIEYPQSVYTIDRVKEKNAISVTFELAAPFDLQGIKLPFRTVLKDVCPWKYKDGVANPESSGCNWCANFHTTEGTYSYEATDIYVNRTNEYIVYDVDSTATDWALGPDTTINSYYYTTGNAVKRVEDDGSLVDVTINKYWQATVDSASDTPSEDSSEWRLVHPLLTYASDINIYKYTEPKFSTYVLYNSEVWQPKLLTQYMNNHISAPFGGSKYWVRGDQCGKSIASCKARYHAAPSAHGALVDANSNKIWLPFGGFPGSRKF